MENLTSLYQVKIDDCNIAKLISDGICGIINIYVMNTKSNSFQILPPGQLQNIINSHPNKTQIRFEEANLMLIKRNLVNVAHTQIITYRDFWVENSLLQSYLDPYRSSIIEMDPDNPDYASELDNACIVYNAAINDKTDKMSMKEKIQKHLNLLYPGLSKQAKQRITLVTNTTAGKRAGRKPKK